MKGYDDEIAKNFVVALQSYSEERATTMIKGLTITLYPELISRVTTIPLGVKWVKEIMLSTATKQYFFLPGEDYIEDKNGVRREILPYP